MMEQDAKKQEYLNTNLASVIKGKPVCIEPDLGFIRILRQRTGDSFMHCFQCGTCSSTCTLSPDSEPFPRKEMAWANWGMKDQLLKDVDIWLCYQCNDCSTRCPRGAKPGDLLASIRQESIIHYSFPRFIGRWISQPAYIPLLLGIPVALLGLALYLKEPIENAFNLSPDTSNRIIYAYSNFFPHWLLNSFFILLSLLILFAVIIGVVRFWKSLKATDTHGGGNPKTKGLGASIISVLKSVISHDDFTQCTTARMRYVSHLSVFFGFFALSAVSIWVVTAGNNPLINSDFVYPFSFWNPWKVLANLGGIALLGGCLLMIRDRLKSSERINTGSFSDWTFLALLLLVTGTGFITEVLHYIRLEPHRHIAYFAHLVFICALLMYLPYSKFAHIIYRTIALIYAEHTNRKAVSKNKPQE